MMLLGKMTKLLRKMTMMIAKKKLLLGVLMMLIAAERVVGAEKKAVCEPITIPMCKDIGYNSTRLPNQFNHATQEEAGLEVHQFWPLVRIECSPDLRFFLCSMYTPICINTYPEPLPACRSVCERAREGCLPIMQKYGFEWPSRMSCALLPEYGGKELCMDAKAQDPSSRGPMNGPTPTLPPPPPAATPEARNTCPCAACGFEGTSVTHFNDLVQLRSGDPLYNVSVGWGPLTDCASPCVSPFFSKPDQEFTELWLSVWSIVCCLSTALTFATFLLDPSRYHYPERSIMYLSLCYFLVSLGFLIRLSVGHKALSCALQSPDQSPSPSNLLHSRENIPTLQPDSGEVVCSLVFVLIYMFSMASSLWWVVLTLTWFLSAGLKWAEESISRYSWLFHTVVWGIPTLKTTLILALGLVEGDDVAGICYAGTRNTWVLIGFVVVPLTLYLITGISFLVLGFSSLFKIRSIIREQGGSRQTADKLEKLMVKIGIFGILYIVPAGTVIACGVYEALNRERWEEDYSCRGCQLEVTYPDFSVLMLKYFMQLAVGITAGFWVWSGKTVDAWSRVLGRLLNFSRFTKPVGKQGAPLPPLPRTFTSPAVATPGVDNHYSTIPRRTRTPVQL